VLDPAADRERVADFVRRALPRELAHREISWPHVLAYDERSIRLTLTRGALLIPSEITLGQIVKDAWADLVDEDHGPWWTPATKPWAQELTRRLVHAAWLKHLPFREADESGHLRVTVWRDGERYVADHEPGTVPVHLVLEAGLSLERGEYGTELKRWGQLRGVTIERAIAEGRAVPQAPGAGVGSHRGAGAGG
jgi:hypothetical protein